MTTIRRVLTTSVLTAGVILGIAPAALAGPPPEPTPAPTPATADASNTAKCADGEVMQDGNCVPAMTPIQNTAGDGAQPPEAPIRITNDESSSSTSGIGADLVPNVNGTPCTGYWASMACDSQTGDQMPAVQPRTTLSDSP